MAVVLGAPTKRGCFDEAAKLLASGFASYRAIDAAKAGSPVGTPIAVRRGTVAQVVGLASGDLRLTVPRADATKVKVEIKVPAEVAAPVKKGQVLGEVVVTRGGESLGRVEVVAASDVESTSWWSGWF